jgi:hypothetical protein
MSCPHMCLSLSLFICLRWCVKTWLSVIETLAIVIDLALLNFIQKRNSTLFVGRQGELKLSVIFVLAPKSNVHTLTGSSYKYIYCISRTISLQKLKHLFNWFMICMNIWDEKSQIDFKNSYFFCCLLFSSLLK